MKDQQKPEKKKWKPKVHPFEVVRMMESYIAERPDGGKIMSMSLANEKNLFRYHVIVDDNLLEMLAQSCMKSIAESAKRRKIENEVGGRSVIITGK